MGSASVPLADIQRLLTAAPVHLEAALGDLPLRLDQRIQECQDTRLRLQALAAGATGLLPVFRASNHPIGGVDPTDANRVVITFGSYINRDSDEHRGCTPTGFAADGINTYTGVKTGGCNNDILYSVSTNRGSSFAGTVINPRQLPVVTDGAKQSTTDQFWQGATFNTDGTLVASYYDRSYRDDNATGYSDITVSASHDRLTFAHRRVTSSAMPPPTQFGGVFYGDYAGLTVAGNTAYPVWSDTRTVDEFLCPGTATPENPPTICTGSAPNAPFANDQDTYLNSVPIP